MLNLKKVAVTGGLSCGKSSVCHILKELGAYIVNADSIVHGLLSPKTPAGKKVIELIGSDIVVQDRIDRSKIAQKVFNNSELLHSLEQILHPEVRHEIEKEYLQAIKNGKSKLFVAEIPLLFEADLGCYDAVIAVVADEATSKKRFVQATGYGEEDYVNRMSRQLSTAEKANRADFIIHNDGDMDDLRQSVLKVFNQLTDSSL